MFLSYANFILSSQVNSSILKRYNKTNLMCDIDKVFQYLDSDVTWFTLQYHRHYCVCYLLEMFRTPLKIYCRIIMACYDQ